MTTLETARFESPSGLAVQLCANGAIRRLDHRDVMINSFLGNELDGSAGGLFLRRHGERPRWIPLTGPRGPGHVVHGPGALAIEGEWENLAFRVELRLAASAPAWFWHVTVVNDGDDGETIDLIYAQDLALHDYGMIRLNEYYVSHYVDHTPLDHPRAGVAVASRQNLSVGGRHPWTVIGALGRGVSFATDALDLFGLAARAGAGAEGLDAPRLSGVRRQHEHSLVAIQDEAVSLEPGASTTRGFFAWFEPDHPGVTADTDLAFVDQALALAEASATAARPVATAGEAHGGGSATLFSACPRLAVRDLADDELALHFGAERRAEERSGGALLSFFTGDDAHVVLPAKELGGLRPHGQILRSGAALVPDESALTSTVWMGGVFHSMVTQGHVSINRFLSTTHGYLGIFHSHGQRMFVEVGGEWRRLDQPSAFEMTPGGARWLYAHRHGLLEVRSWATVDHHELWLTARVLDGAPSRFLISHHVAMNGDDGATPGAARYVRDGDGLAVSPIPDSDVGRRFPSGTFRISPAAGTSLESVGGDELLFVDGRSRNQPFLTLVTAPSTAVGLRITGHLLPQAREVRTVDEAEARAAADSAAADRLWRRASLPLSAAAHSGADGRAAAQLREILPWLAHDALVHYLSPRGLEQYSGGGWGTRDVCQGPVELLLALGEWGPIRDVLTRVFRTQNADGDWPQWFMFFERERNIRPGDSHGDIVFWPLLALGQYLLASDDFAFLDERLPFFHFEGDAHAEHAPLSGHVERALARIESRRIPGTHLVSYGHGDWNDSLQPVDRELAERLVSAWTVTLHHQTFATLAKALERAGRGALAERLTAALPGIREDFQRHAVVDDVIAGFVHFPAGGAPHPVIHPRDAATGVRYSLLPMIHAILADLLTPAQVERHREVIRRHLLAPDGARLFDRPFPYRGGIQRQFQRAESSTFFGREIGIMYTHAHLRYAEAMAHLGDAQALLLALRQANPIGLAEVVRNARPRQANCYTSSSDADFRDRYDAIAHYDRLLSGKVAVEGGWRVYSSGAGIAFRLVRECLLGIRLARATLTVDPVLTRALDGLAASAVIDGRTVEVCYRVGARGLGPRALTLDGTALPFEREPNPWRTGAATVAMDDFRRALGGGPHTLVVELE